MIDFGWDICGEKVSNLDTRITCWARIWECLCVPVCFRKKFGQNISASFYPIPKHFGFSEKWVDSFSKILILGAGVASQTLFDQLTRTFSWWSNQIKLKIGTQINFSTKNSKIKLPRRNIDALMLSIDGLNYS